LGGGRGSKIRCRNRRSVKGNKDDGKKSVNQREGVAAGGKEGHSNYRPPLVEYAQRVGKRERQTVIEMDEDQKTLSQGLIRGKSGGCFEDGLLQEFDHRQVSPWAEVKGTRKKTDESEGNRRIQKSAE